MEGLKPPDIQGLVGLSVRSVQLVLQRIEAVRQQMAAEVARDDVRR
jgi:hypothetical protein